MIRSIRPTLLLGLAGVALIAGCGSSPSDAPRDNTTPPSALPSVPPSSPTAPPPAVDDEAANALCSKIEASLSDWRVQGPTLGKPSLNILVQEWALQNGGRNVQVLQDRTIIDRITTEHCADVRRQAIEALAIPDLASGLVGI